MSDDQSAALYNITEHQLRYLLFVTSVSGECRQLAFPSFFFFADKRLVSHSITTVRVRDMDACELLCYQEPNCVSVNFENKASLEGTYRCELNNATHRGHDGEFVDTENYFHHGAEVNLLKSYSFLPSPFPLSFSSQRITFSNYS